MNKALNEVFKRINDSLGGPLEPGIVVAAVCKDAVVMVELELRENGKRRRPYLANRRHLEHTQGS